MDWTEALTRLEAGLARPLPAGAAHVRMAPSPRRDFPPGRLPARRRDASCLVLIFPAGPVARFVLTLRSARLARHAGQVSFPGGAVESGESAESAALREAEEEIGADPASIRIVGSLSPLHIPVSGFLLRPVTAVAPARPGLVPRDGEVEAILEPALADLLDPARIGEESRRIGGAEYRIPFYDLCSHRVWGATAMVLSELAWLLDPPPFPTESSGR